MRINKFTGFFLKSEKSILRHTDLSSYNFRKIIFGLVLLCFGACSTPEFQAERSFCEASFLDQIPQMFRQRIVTNYRTEVRRDWKVSLHNRR